MGPPLLSTEEQGRTLSPCGGTAMQHPKAVCGYPKRPEM
ncbi:hypothetical protein RKD45_003785 [Streptomyces griseus]|nr:hypothetical protein F750_3884 [Streptomyces sp. PAMC 26508]MDF9871079.1 hypothetical protein [Streptomyces pratensis]SNX77636.1 hypothetical protein SAMN05421860_10534 [Streptomyces microflavus]